MSKYSEVPVRVSSPMARAHICADCSAPDPSWASINRGVLICDECCSVHRSLGRHISQVKSLKKSCWSPSLLSMVQLVGSFANNTWEHLLRDPSATQNKHRHRKPNPRDPAYPTKAEFIRAKYHFLTFMNKQKDEINSLDDISKQLHSSVRTTSLETSLRLLSLGADPNYYHPERGNCPLHIAAQAGQIHQVELLVVYGADPGAFDCNNKTPVDYARQEGENDLAERLIECQYELTDRLASFLCNRKPDHRTGQHFIIPEMADNTVDLSELAKAAKRRLQGIPNKLFEDLAMDAYDEVDRRENEATWVSSQTTSDVSDKQTVPFLPVNPEFTSTRNQGRQKLARFNPREFATLIIDILNEVKRRQQGLSAQTANILKDLDKAAVLRKGPSQRSVHKPGSLSDEEPLYDSVASDEDYASIGDSHSLKEVGLIVAPPTADQQTDSDKFSPSPPPSVISQTESGGSSEATDTPIMLEEYMQLKRVLIESQIQVKQLVQAKNDLKQEVALLQNMVQKLLHENQKLQVAEAPPDPLTVTNGYDTPQTSTVRGPSSRGSRPQSMFEARDPQKHQHWATNQQPLKEEPSKTEPEPHSEAEQTAGGSLDHQTSQSESDYDNSADGRPPGGSDDQPPGGDTADPGTRTSGRSDSSSQTTPTNSNPCLSQEVSTAETSIEGASSLPTQDQVVKKTENITKEIQELLVRARDGKHNSFAVCAEKIHQAVLEMKTLFPAMLSSATMQAAVQALSTGSDALQKMCSSPAEDSSTFSKEVIQCAFIIAKAAKQLVSMFE